MKRTLKTESSTFEKDMMSDFPVANRREARKLGLLRSKSSEAERERHKPAHTVGERGRLHGLCSWRGRREPR